MLDQTSATSSETKNSEIIYNPIETLHIKNQRILDFIASQTPPLPPDLVNSKIVAQFRLDISHLALTELIQYAANGMSKKKMKKIQTRLENKIVKEIAFGSLQDLIDQANVELERIRVKGNER